MKLIIRIIAFAVWLAALTSCHNAQYHLEKFVSKGGTFKADTVTLEFRDTLIINGDTIIIDSLINVPCPDAKPDLPPTRAELRNERKAAEDSMKHVENMYKLQIKEMERSFNFKLKEANLKMKEAIQKSNQDLKMKDKENKALKLQLKAAQKAAEASVFWTKLGRLWWVFVLIGAVGTIILLLWLRRKA